MIRIGRLEIWPHWRDDYYGFFGGEDLRNHCGCYLVFCGFFGVTWLGEHR